MKIVRFKIVSIIFLIEFLTFSLARAVPENEESFETECQTPERQEAQIENGLCVHATKCINLVKYLQEMINKSNEENYFDNIKKWKCGPKKEDNKNPKVCCPMNWIDYNSNATVTTTTLVPVINDLRPAKTTDHPKSIPFTTEAQAASGSATNNTNSGSLLECGQQPIHIPNRIFGGDVASQREFPWLVKLMRRTDEGEVLFSCTGALISSKVVLTAAHCLVAPSITSIGSLYAVHLGDLDTECTSMQCEFREVVLVSSYIVHPNYTFSSRNHDNDIGLVSLRTDVKFTKDVFPICLWKNKLNDIREYHVAGWGRTESFNISPKKLKTVLPSFPWDNCNAKYKTIKINLTERQICAGGMKNKDTCQGDSGGPLMAVKNNTWYIVGIVSFGVTCGREGWPGIYVNVPSYIEWINQKML